MSGTVRVLAIAQLTWVTLVTISALNCRKWQMIDWHVPMTPQRIHCPLLRTAGPAVYPTYIPLTQVTLLRGSKMSKILAEMQRTYERLRWETIAQLYDKLTKYRKNKQVRMLYRSGTNRWRIRIRNPPAARRCRCVKSLLRLTVSCSPLVDRRWLLFTCTMLYQRLWLQLINLNYGAI